MERAKRGNNLSGLIRQSSLLNRINACPLKNAEMVRRGDNAADAQRECFDVARDILS